MFDQIDLYEDDHEDFLKVRRFDVDKIRYQLETLKRSKKELIEKGGITPQTLNRLIKKYDIKCSYTAKGLNLADILLYLQGGKRKAWIARKVGCSVQSINRIAKQNGFVKSKD